MDEFPRETRDVEMEVDWPGVERTGLEESREAAGMQRGIASRPLNRPEADGAAPAPSLSMLALVSFFALFSCSFLRLSSLSFRLSREERGDQG